MNVPMLRVKTLLLVPVLGLAFAGCGGAKQSESSDSSAGPTASLAANPTSVPSGGTSTLTWSSTDATSCTASGTWSGTKATSGNQSTGPLTASSDYFLTCNDSSGGSGSASATVTVPGTPPPPPPPPPAGVSLTASPIVVANGLSSTLSWSSTNATSCTASGGWSGTKAPTGSESTSALTTTTLFNLTCGAGNASVIVSVLLPPGALPVWVNALAMGQWYEIPNTAMVSVDGAHPAGAWSKVIAWTSFVVDTRTSKVYSVANGGHNDYSGNEVDVLDLERAQPVWTEVLAPTPDAQRTNCSAYYADGRPTSRHTYYGVTFNEFDDRIMLLGGAWSCSGGGWFHATSSYNIGANSYSAAGTHPDQSGAFGITGIGAAVANPFTGDIYLNVNQKYGRWNRSSNTFTSDLSPTGQPSSGSDSLTAFDTSRGRIFILGGQQGDHHLYTLSTNSVAAAALSGANASDVANVGQAAMVYVAALDRFLVRKAGAGGTVYQINAATFEVTTLVTTGGASVPSTVNGPYNKFLYVPRLNGAVYVPCYSVDPGLSCATGNAWFLRLH